MSKQVPAPLGIPEAGLWIFGDIITINHQRRDYQGQNRT